ncbi:MAG: LTA synthase family protein [Flavobacteriales bacterium]|nr:LTA synthase family protein [Flavobacteriales bacterium]
MKGTGRFLRYLLQLALFWMALFLLQRSLFLALNWNKVSPLPWSDILLTQRYGQPMDLSMSGYLLLPVVLFSIPLLFHDRSIWRTILRMYLIVLVLLSCIIAIADVGLFQSWGSRVNLKALSYLAYPREAFGSMAGAPVLLLVPTLLVLCLLALFVVRRVKPSPELHEGHWLWKVGGIVVAIALCLVAARGGIQDLPIDKSWAYYSRHSVLNLSALNGTWNFMEVLVEPPEFDANPYAYTTTSEADARFASIHSQGKGNAPSIFTTARPNILIVLLESWTADIIEPLGGDSGVTPQFTRLAKDGLLFRNFYSTGFRTEQGICAMLSAFPSQPKTTVIRKFGKFDQLPSLVHVLDSSGFASTYYYAGDVEFANTRSYLEAMGFDVIHDEHSFPIIRRTRWGAYDEELFDFHLGDAERPKQPFFHIIMTSTSHEPFDAPVDEGFKGGDPQLYRNTVHYTDRSLGAFMDRARNMPWWESTLMIVVADHGHFLPHYREAYAAARHRIPLLMTGGALRPELRGTTNDTYASHVDLAATLLHQLHLPADRFTCSRDLFDPTVSHSAFWTFDEGFGMADSVQTVVWEHVGQRVVELRDSTRLQDRDRLLQDGKAQLQVLLDRYIGFNQ